MATRAPFAAVFFGREFLGKSAGRATVTANSTRHTSSSWIPMVGMRSLWLRIAETGACELFPWTVHIFAPLKTTRDSVCHVIFIRKETGWVWPDLDSQVCILDREYNVRHGIGRRSRFERGGCSCRRQSRSEFTPGQFITHPRGYFPSWWRLLVAEMAANWAYHPVAPRLSQPG